MKRSISISLLMAAAVSTHPAIGQKAADIAGTWTGTSTCVGYRPACKDEIVVYRFVPVDGHLSQLRLLADKIIDGKRVPMGALVFDCDEQAGTLRCEFEVGPTHGVWSFTAAADSMTGTLIVLPDSTRARDVRVHRVKPADVPPEPAPEEYEGD